MSKVRVKSGTPVEGECDFGVLRRVPFKVRECTDYSDKNRPSYEQMEKLAILVEPRRLAGFEREERKMEPEPVVASCEI